MVAPAIALGLGVYELLAAGAAATGLGAFAVARRREITDGVSEAVDAAADTALDLTLKVLPRIVSATVGVRPQGLWRHTEDVALRDSISVPGLDLNLDVIRPWSPPIVHIEETSPVAHPQPAHPPLEKIDGGQTATPLPPRGPEDPLSGWRRLTEGAKEIGRQIKTTTMRVAQNRWVQGAYTLYRYYNYGLAAVATAEIARRMVAGDKDHGPILYDYIYEPLFGDSATARTLLGGQQLMAAETSAGMVAVSLAKMIVPKWLAATLDAEKFVSHLQGFLSIHAYSALGNWTFIEHQMTANNTDAANVDFNRATRTAEFFGFTSIAYFAAKDGLINLPRFGRMGFQEWWMRWGTAKAPSVREALTSTKGFNWLGAWWHRGVETFLGARVAAFFAPHYIPKLSTFCVYALFATAYRNATQAVASYLQVLEDSDVRQSLWMTNARNVPSLLLFDPYLYLGARSNSLRSIFGNQLAFMGVIYFLNPYFSPFDGKDVAVAEADRALKAAFAKDSEGLQQAVLAKPLTQLNFSVPPETDLSVKTWAELTRHYASNAALDPNFVTALVATMRTHLQSSESGERRVGMALGVMLSQIALTPKATPQEVSSWREGLEVALGVIPSQLESIPEADSQEVPLWRTELREVLEQDGVQMEPRHAGRPLDTQELDRVFRDINAGHYDESPLFQFPYN